MKFRVVWKEQLEDLLRSMLRKVASRTPPTREKLMTKTARLGAANGLVNGLLDRNAPNKKQAGLICLVKVLRTCLGYRFLIFVGGLKFQSMYIMYVMYRHRDHTLKTQIPPRASASRTADLLKNLR